MFLFFEGFQPQIAFILFLYSMKYSLDANDDKYP